ncbi:ornithine cyclodeaminase family protein [Pollutimonas bauzanensis]|uniref:Ornithine cyclodeaminase n=1 Tax=Pollutimonas bauzanensis TaxID=658167 RepID=A0A1M5M198_9BURK|nr:ornithine cyclodeaminase family protein [Pollutimonas bauzanensis]SHG70669.1 ornithine cyclodeaminase [Pollutimonas bauzanensis]
MLTLNATQTRTHLPFPQMIDAIENMFRSGCIVPQRHMHAIDPPAGRASLLLMPAWQLHGRLGVKIVTVHPDNSDRGMPALNSTFTLFDAADGTPLAHLDGNEITSRRTAAASALAARFLSRRDATRLLVVGAGRVASLIPQAYQAVCDIQQVKVWDIDPAMAQALIERLRLAGFDAEWAHDLERAVKEADIVSCATLATQPLIHGDWLQPGMHLDLIGSFTAAMREADETCLLRANVYIDTEEALQKSGDFLAPLRDGVFRAEDVCATLEQLCKRLKRGRRDPNGITLFKAVGTALEDLAVASLAYDGAKQADCWNTQSDSLISLDREIMK